MVGCLNLASAYQDGHGVPVDVARAAALFRQACNGGQSVACSWLGDMLVAGKGVAQNRTEAQRAYKQACDGGFSHSCEELERLRNNP